METSKRRQMPTTNACANFSFRGLRKKNFTLFRSFREYFRHAENYFHHCQKLHTSQQRQRPFQCAHARDLTMAAGGRAFGPTRAAPGMNNKQIFQLTQLDDVYFDVLISLGDLRQKKSVRFFRFLPC